MNDLHDRFTSWLAHGADGDPTRDVAVHASACDQCLRSAAAMDALAAIDLGLAGAPPTVAAPSVGWRPSGSARALVGTLASLALAGAIGIVALNALRPAPANQAAVGGSPSRAGEVLGDQGGPATASPGTEEASPSGRESPSSDATASALATPAGPPLVRPVTPPPAAIATPAPVRTVTPIATASPTPLITPTATPTPVPTPVPTPTPLITPPPTPVPTPLPTPEPTIAPPPSEPTP